MINSFTSNTPIVLALIYFQLDLSQGQDVFLLIL